MTINNGQKNKINTIIFDMDGVLIDSEEIWKRAEREVFSAVGVELSDKLCRITASMTTAEVTKFWFEKQPWTNKSLKEVEYRVIERVAHFIKKEGKAIEGIRELVSQAKSMGYKIGLATNSPACLIPIVLEKLQLENYFDVTSSAENEPEGKPDPSVYLTVANKLNSKPVNCIAIEDSHSGILAAKRAGMKTVLITKDTNNKIADIKISNYSQFDFSFL